VLLLLQGVLGFIPGLAPGGELFGLFNVDMVHNGFNIVSGLIFLLAGISASESAAKGVALFFGFVFTVLTLWGLLGDGTILNGLTQLNMADNILHLILAITSLGVGLSRERVVRV
jgi:hypothetical protein